MFLPLPRFGASNTPDTPGFPHLQQAGGRSAPALPPRIVRYPSTTPPSQQGLARCTVPAPAGRQLLVAKAPTSTAVLRTVSPVAVPDPREHGTVRQLPNLQQLDPEEGLSGDVSHGGGRPMPGPPTWRPLSQTRNINVIAGPPHSALGSPQCAPEATVSSPGIELSANSNDSTPRNLHVQKPVSPCNAVSKLSREKAAPVMELPPWLLLRQGSTPSTSAAPSESPVCEDRSRSLPGDPVHSIRPASPVKTPPSSCSIPVFLEAAPSNQAQTTCTAALSLQPASQTQGRTVRIVFLLPNVTESDEFMQTTYSAFFPEAGNPTDINQVELVHGEEMVTIMLHQLGPVDALEDVQRRARRVSTRKTPSNPRRSSGCHQFKRMTNLPTLEDESTAKATTVVYLLRPFESPKDAERQLGPILILEASYQGSSHRFVPNRLVVALEDPGDLGSASTSGIDEPGESQKARLLGPFGAKVQERLVQRGLEMPIVSIERKNHDGVRCLLQHILEFIPVDQDGSSEGGRVGRSACGRGGGGVGSITDTESDGQCISKVLGTKGLLERPLNISAPAPQVLPATLVTFKRGGRAESYSELQEESLPSSLAKEAVGGQATSVEVASKSSISCSRTASSVDRSTAAQERIGDVAPVGIPGSCVGDQVSADRDVHLLEAHGAAGDQHVCEDHNPQQELIQVQTANSMSGPAWRWADAAARVDVPSASTRDVAEVATRRDYEQEGKSPSVIAAEITLESVNQQAGVQEISSSPPCKAGDMPPTLHGSPEATPGRVPADDPGGKPPTIQVGDHYFTLPPPEFAVERISDLWRPGTMMVVITTQHYGTPLLCPNGDIYSGLVNLAPSGQSSELVPLYWQNLEEAKSASVQGSNAKKHATTCG